MIRPTIPPPVGPWGKKGGWKLQPAMGLAKQKKKYNMYAVRERLRLRPASQLTNLRCPSVRFVTQWTRRNSISIAVSALKNLAG